MKATWLVLCAASMTLSASAMAFDKGDPKVGKALVDKSCLSCHASMYGGDGSKIYTRPDHKVKTPQQLAARISGCNANTGAGWFPEEEAHVAAYLNQQYYKFK
jgi:mono/diheme cytochrome c family protein